MTRSAQTIESGPDLPDYPSVQLPPSLDALPSNDPVRAFVAAKRYTIKSRIPELAARNPHVPETLASSAPDLTNDHIPAELPEVSRLEELDLTELTLLEDFHQLRLTYLKLGRDRPEATAVTCAGMCAAIFKQIGKEVIDTGQGLRQVDLVQRFADCYRDPASVA